MFDMETEIDEAQQLWMMNRRFTPDPKINALIRGEVENYLEEAGGYPAPAHFERFYLQLLHDGKIQPFRGALSEQPAAAPATPPDVVRLIESASVSELRNRYRTDTIFRKQYDLYEQSKAQRRTQPGVFSLTREEYYRIPAAQVVQKYRSDHPTGFKAAVDKLISQGKI